MITHIIIGISCFIAGSLFTLVVFAICVVGGKADSHIELPKKRLQWSIPVLNPIKKRGCRLLRDKFGYDIGGGK